MSQYLFNAEGLAYKHVSPFGGALVAARSFEPGDEVVRDKPIMMTSEDSDLLDRVYKAHDDFGIRADVLGKVRKMTASHRKYTQTGM